MAVKMILDCDTGVDDTMAILYAALHPDIDLLGVGAVWGNVDVETATRNSLHTLQMVNRKDIPVARGTAQPLSGRETYFASFVHGDDGQGNAYDDAPVGPAAEKNAVQQIIDLVHTYPGEVWLVPVGPLTNIASALALDPDLPRLVRGVSLMGGAALAPGNVTPVAEANIGHDAEAASAVFRAPWPIIMCGLDATMKVLITPERRKTLDAGGVVSQYLSRIMEFYGEYIGSSSFGQWTATMHDTIAVAAAAGTVNIKRSACVNVDVDSSGGLGHGQTICDLRGIYVGIQAQPGAHTTVLLDVDDSIADDALELIANFRQPGEV